MGFLSRTSVSTRLGLIVALALLALLVTTASGLWAQAATQKVTRQLIEGELAAVQTLDALNVASGHLRRYEKDMLINLQDAKAVAGYEDKWNRELAEAQGHAAKALELLGSAESAKVKALADGLTQYGQGVRALVVRLKAGEFPDTQSANRGLEPVKASIRVIDGKVEELVKIINQRVDERRAAVATAARQQTVVACAVLVAAALLLLMLAVGVARSITHPLAAASQALGELAQGDLSRRIEANGDDELAQMMRSLAQTQQALRGLVQAIQGNAESVSTASGEIAQGNLDLSGRTEQQAANLQETAAAMEQLSGTVRNSADNARQADELARSTSQAATRGNGVVANVVQTMGEIQTSSRRIGEITGVIDGIAFQTNILALNAAVEAARAGEQGRGFAVVAAEVRLLAQRSAEAARQIKGLIGDSIGKVEAGGRLVQDAGNSMEEVVRGVQQVSELVSQIRVATQEQHTGLEQVGQSIQALDRSTQQNAALVEESAAAAESLRRQATQLNAAAAVFRLEG